MIFTHNRLLTTILALGVLGAGCALAKRHAVEMRNRAVEIAVDYSEVAQIAGASGAEVEDALVRLRRAGATSAAVQERTIADLAASGAVAVRDTRDGAVVYGATPEIVEALRRQGLRTVSLTPAVAAPIRYEAAIAVDVKPEYVLPLPVGLPEDAVGAVRGAGMRVVARLVNYPGVRRPAVELTAERLKRAGVRTVIFAADQVLGFRGTVGGVADVLKRNGLVYGSVEFARQKGDQRLSELMMPNVARVHSITAAEMGTLDRATAVERFVRAARERNIRLAYVRMFDLSDADPVATNAEYISAIARGLRNEGFALGTARAFDDATVPLPSRVLMALGSAAGVTLLVLSVVRVSTGVPWAVFAGSAVVLVGSIAPGIVLGLKAAALGTAIVFPILAVLYASSNRPEERSRAPLRAFVGRAASRFAGVLAISAAGGFIVAGLLSRQEFMLRVDQFAGVKLAQVVPILAVAFAFAAGVGWGTDGWREQRERAAANLRVLGAQPILIWQSVIAAVLLVMVALLLARSGNEPGLGVSSIELRFRSILDTLLYVRPRTKEFLVGHPALFLGIAAALGGRRAWAALLLVVGMIGEVSLINTFCHIHTPVAVSVLRSAIGGVVGLAIGTVLLLLFSRSEKKQPPTA